MRVNRRTRVRLTVGERAVREVNEFTYLGIITSDGGAEKDVQRRIGKTTSVWQRLSPVWCSALISMAVKIHLCTTVIGPTAIQPSRTWKVTKNLRLRRILGISYQNHITNEEVLKPSRKSSLNAGRNRPDTPSRSAHTQDHNVLSTSQCSEKISKPLGFKGMKLKSLQLTSIVGADGVCRLPAVGQRDLSLFAVSDALSHISPLKEADSYRTRAGRLAGVKAVGRQRSVLSVLMQVSSLALDIKNNCSRTIKPQATVPTWPGFEGGTGPPVRVQRPP
ncbi:hypothetical protein MHYP_G00303140 [Metynnis hypsauchen]